MKIAILGSGLMGRVLALSLYQAGLKDLTLIDKSNMDGINSPAFIAAGMLAPFCESILGGQLIFELGTKSIQLWHSYLRSLSISHLINTNGTLLLAKANFNSEISHYLAKIKFNTSINGFYFKLNRGELNTIEPELNYNEAYLLNNEACLNAREVFKLIGGYLATKIQWYCNTNILQSMPLITCPNISQTKEFSWIIDCRGLGATKLFPNLRGIRGEIIRLHAPDVNISRPVRLFHPRQNIYISPYANNHYVVGATEIEAEDYSPASVKSCIDLMSYACTIHPGFAEARILEINSNCRPTLASNLPQLIAKKRTIAINGLYRHGYLLAPALAQLVINFIKTGYQEYPQIWS